MTIRIVTAPGASAARKRRRGLCVTPRCRNAKAGRSHRCNTCNNRIFRARHPERHLWNNLKKSARKRRIPFTLTFEEFRAFCLANDFVARVGNMPDSLTVDRIDPAGGYSADNIRALPNIENATLGGALAGTGHRAAA